MTRWASLTLTGPNGFRAKHVGPLSWFLGVEITQHDNFTVTISQSQYVKKLLERFVPARPASLIKHAMPCNPLTFQSLTCATNRFEAFETDRFEAFEVAMMSRRVAMASRRVAVGRRNVRRNVLTGRQ